MSATSTATSSAPSACCSNPVAAARLQVYSGASSPAEGGEAVMRVVLLFLLSLLSWPALATPPAAAPSAGTEVRIVETWPAADDGYLPRNQSFYVRIAYRSDTPVGIWLHPMYQGQPARAGSNPSARYVGEGETLGWFFLMQPGDRVDEIRVVVGNGSGLG